MVQVLSYGLDGKIKNIQHLGEGNWNGGVGNTTDYDGAMAQRTVSARNNQRIIQQYKYNARGHAVGIVDGNGNSGQYCYNSLGKVSERTDQLGYTETFRYDEEATLPCIPTGTADSFSVPATCSGSLYMKRQWMQKGKTPA